MVGMLQHDGSSVADRDGCQAAYFRRAARHLGNGGRRAIVETWSIGWLTRIFGHATDPETIKAETVAAGYELVESHDFLRLQSFLVFRPSANPSA